MALAFRIDIDKSKKKQRTDKQERLFFAGDNNAKLILIHGLTGTPNEMRFLANFFHLQGYTVDCPCLANHGQHLDILKETTWQEFYQSARDALREAVDGGGDIFVAGLSMGALFSLLLAEEFPDKIRGVSCLSPTLFYDGWNMPWYQCFLPLVSNSFIGRWFYFKEDPPYGVKNKGVQKRIHSYYSQASLDNIENVQQYGYPYFPVTLLHQLHLVIKYLKKRLKNIRVPVQLIQAKDDDMTSVKNSQFIYDRISSLKKEVVILYNSYHVITADQERYKVAQEMERFFNQILSKSDSLNKESSIVF